jgi:DNA-binding NtrC family response regulator
MVKSTHFFKTTNVPVSRLRLVVTHGPDQGATLVEDGDNMAIGTASDNALQLTDQTVSRYHVELRRHDDMIEVVDLNSTNGTFAGQVRIDRGRIAAGTELSMGATRLRVEDAGVGRAPAFKKPELGGIYGESAAMRRLLHAVSKAAASEATVLLRGESGSGKELVARALHDLSPRSQAPFVTVDCGSLSPTLVASELFGHEKGAFTGAHRQRQGALERAHGGTLFLDELGELPGDLQAALLGALERRRFTRLGGDDEIAVDIRVVCATHRDLRREVNADRFRLDLYYRLAVLKLTLPPLRERREDIPGLVQRFAIICGHHGDEPLFDEDAMAQLMAHEFPGNVRELRNIVEATVVMGDLPELDESDRPAASGSSAERDDFAGASYKEARGKVLAQFEAAFLAKLMERSGGVVSEGARQAKMDRSHLLDLLKKHGLR